MKRTICSFVVVSMCLVLLGWMAFPSVSSAIPAFARKYNADCTLCHHPAIPRLNRTGLRYRWGGYRMPNEFGKKQDMSKVGNFLALRARGRFLYENPEAGKTKSEIQWHDTTIFYAGALTENISAFNEIEVEHDEVGLVAQLQGIWGSPGRFISVRFGQFHSLKGVGLGSFDRPTGISVPLMFGQQLTTSPVPYKLSSHAKGIELAQVVGNSRFIAQVLNGVTKEEEDTSKDVLLAYEQMLGDATSSFTLYAYRGVWTTVDDPDSDSRIRFYRLGGAANKIFSSGSEILGGYIYGEDGQPASVGPTITGSSGFLELQQYLEEPNMTLLVRYDWLDPDDDISGNTQTKQTVGWVHTFQRNLKISVEGSRLNDDFKNETDYNLVTEAFFVF